MKLGIAVLVLAYGLSQFYRAFLAVLTPALKADIGATPEDLAFASGVWFLTFAAMQIPVGEALDRFGPRITAVTLFGLGGAGGALAFALAQTPPHISLAMALIGIGCSPVLMAAYYIFARVYAPAVFATLAGAIIGFGSFGNIAGSAPLAWAALTFGWRTSMMGVAILTLVVAVLMWVCIRDPERVVAAQKGSVLDVLKMPVLWPIFAIMAVCYAPAAGIRGLWAGPYAADVFKADATAIGNITLAMGLAMIAGSFIYGPLDRLLRRRKWLIFGGNFIVLVALLALFVNTEGSIWFSVAMIITIGLAGATYPLVIAHGKSFLPPHLTGRGVTLLNLFSIGGAGVMQFATGRIKAGQADPHKWDGYPYALIFLAFAAVLAVGLVAYLFAKDRTE